MRRADIPIGAGVKSFVDEDVPLAFAATVAAHMRVSPTAGASGPSCACWVLLGRPTSHPGDLASYSRRYHYGTLIPTVLALLGVC